MLSLCACLGKTTLALKIIQQRELLVSNPFFDHCWYCYGAVVSDTVKQELVGAFGLQNVTFTKGIPKNLETDSIFNDESKAKLILVDDLMSEFKNNDFFAKLSTMFSHHKNCTIIFLVQNFFEKSLRTVTLNCQYLILFDSVRDRSLIATLNKQMFPDKPKFLQGAMQIASKYSMHPYIFLNLRSSSDENLRVQTNILPCEPTVVIL